MKVFVISLLLLVGFQQCVSSQKSTLAGTKIVYDGPESAAINDLRQYLSSYSAGTITVQSTALGDRTGQEFYIAIKGNNTELKYTTNTSLENAVYTYLDMLGFRWYGPGDNWTIKPKSIQRNDIAGKWMAPSFRNRSFFGTGGLDVPLSFDPQFQYREKWYTWKRRNRYNADFALVGHTGQAFYLENKKLLDKNPQWFNGDAGKQNGRIKIEDPAAVNAYKAWIKQRYEQNKSAFITLGVDPEDGRGGKDDPLPSSMKGISNHADKWWWLANEVAKDYPENNKKVAIMAFAYGDGTTNALTPSFTLRKNVYPVIMPYAFQQAYLPEEMVKTWSAKVSGNMAMYDYWNITQWSLGMPQFDIYSIPSKLKFWKENKVDGVYLETTDAAGPMGHALWLNGQLQWNINQDFDKLYQQYLNECFGKGASAMKNMFDRWSKNYQGAGDVALSLNDLATASAAVTKGSSEWLRINELKAYVNFMKRYYALDGSQAAKDQLMQYMYSIHSLMMVQTAAFVGQNYITTTSNNASVGARTKAITATDIDDQFNNDIKSNPVKYQPVSFQFDLDKVKYTIPINNSVWLFGGYENVFFFKAPFSGSVELDIGAESVTAASVYSDDKVWVKENIGVNNFQFKETINGRTWNMKKWKITVTKGKMYTIKTSNGYGRVKMITPGIVLFKNPGLQDFDNYAYPWQYFYVPKNATEIIFYDELPEGTNDRGYLVKPDGKPVKREATGMKNIYRVPVDAASRGKVWTANFGHPLWSFRNIPNYSSLQPFEYQE